MGVYIKNMDMPKEGFVELLVRDDGTVLQTGQSYRIDGSDYYTPYIGEIPVMYKAAPVPPHGRLIDADALMDEAHQPGAYGYVDAIQIENAPTVIPASEEGET